MADILWDKKVGTYDIVDSNYFTPEPHAHNIAIDIEIDVYEIEYDWGLYAGGEGIKPLYLGQMKGQVTSANFTIDSTSDMRSTCSLSIILDEGSPFIVHSNDYIFWQHVWLKITKKYNYINDIDMYPMFDWGDRVGLWNNNGLFRSDPSQMVIGWFAPNDGSYDYNAESREFSLSCTDIMAFYTDTRGGHLTPWEESHAGVHYQLEDMGYDFTQYPPVKVFDEDFYNDKIRSANYSSGLVLEGSKDLFLSDQQYPNYLANHLMIVQEAEEKLQQMIANGVTPEGENPNDITAALWYENFRKYRLLHPYVEEQDYNFPVMPRDTSLADTYSMLYKVVTDYGHIIPIDSVYIRLQNDDQTLPYDMEFNGDTTLYDVLKKVIELYPRQTMFFDSNRCFNAIQQPLAWCEPVNNAVHFRAREYMDLVLEEHWNVDVSNVANFVVVFGRDDKCHGYYYITPYRAICPNCGHLYEYQAMPSHPDRRFCVRCATSGKGKYDLQRLQVTNDSFCIQFIGTHKKVVYDDNLITEEECFNAAKAIALESCRASKTLTVTLVDRYLSMYQWADKGVGRRIEYKSKLTGETNVYTILKWTNDFSSGTVTLELEPYYTCRDEYILFIGDDATKYACIVLPMPEWTYTLDENGLLTMYIHNGWLTKYSMFKIYCEETNLNVGENEDFWFWNISMNFIGETCEVCQEETETEHQVKVFKYQFKKNGKYLITAQAWSPNVHPSSCPNMEVIEVNCFKDKLLTENGSFVKTEDDSYLLHS
jgi:hypothetical protein